MLFIPLFNVTPPFTVAIVLYIVHVCLLLVHSSSLSSTLRYTQFYPHHPFTHKHANPLPLRTNVH